MKKRILYAGAGYEAIVRENGYFVDKTEYIAKLEQMKTPVFLRPQRFGKSLLCTMSESYYDIRRKDRFEELFGHTWIGRNPTPLRNSNSCFVLHLDFSIVETGDMAATGKTFNHVCNLEMENLVVLNKNRFQDMIATDSVGSAAANLQNILKFIRRGELPLCLSSSTNTTTLPQLIERHKDRLFSLFPGEKIPFFAIGYAGKSIGASSHPAKIAFWVRRHPARNGWMQDAGDGGRVYSSPKIALTFTFCTGLERRQRVRMGPTDHIGPEKNHPPRAGYLSANRKTPPSHCIAPRQSNSSTLPGKASPRKLNRKRWRKTPRPGKTYHSSGWDMPILSKLLAILFVCCAMVLSLFPGEARSFEPGTVPTQQVFPPYELLPLPEYLPEASDEPFSLPPVTPRVTPDPTVGPSFVLTDIVLEGNTVFSDAELKGVAQSFLGVSVTLADLEEIRYRLTLFYVDRGYVNSGALIKPGQQVTDGSVAYLIVEGTLEEIAVTGNGRLRATYIRSRMWPDSQTPFNTGRLQEFFQMLLQDPLIERMDGRILPGPKPGTAVLELDVTRAPPYEVRMGAHNHSSPNLGAETATFDGTLRDLTGWGDALGISLGYSEGMKELEASFNFPITFRDTSLFVRYNISASKVIDTSLKLLDIRSEFSSLEVGVMHPVYRTPRRTFSFGASLKQGESRTYIFKNMPFSFSDGAVDGKSRTTVLRLVQSYQDRTTDQVLAFSSTFIVGLDLLDPTLHSISLPDGEFFAWLGQVQYGMRLGPKAGQVIFSGDLQLTANRLLTMEQFSIGGAGSVRGYRKNTHIGDNGCRLSLEWRVPVWEGRRTGAHQPSLLQVVPFLDYGTAWDKKHPQRKQTADDNNLVSLGAGLMWSSRWLDAELFYGHALKSVDRKEDYHLQDDGILFKVTARFP